MDNNTFFWATGIENTFIPQERPGLRALEEYELTQHYAQWRADLDRGVGPGRRRRDQHPRQDHGGEEHTPHAYRCPRSAPASPGQRPHRYGTSWQFPAAGRTARPVPGRGSRAPVQERANAGEWPKRMAEPTPCRIRCQR